MRKRRYITGFDGLRAIAVIGVIAFHLLPTKIVGGWLGVPLFFVLSGYLITDLLIQEFDRHDKIAPWQFYLRRLRRLYPALVGMLMFTVVMILLFDHQLIYNLRYVVLTNLLYVYNFWAIGHGQSYFQQFGGASPFTHLWSLSIEGQFYLVWPFVLWGILKLRPKRHHVAIGLLVVSGISAFLMAVLYQPDAINRIYYGTDTRLFAILLGTALAFIWPSTHLNPAVQPEVKKGLDIVGGVALTLTLVGLISLNGQQHATYYGLMYLMTAIMTILIAVVAHPSSWLSRGLDNPVLDYLGTRSYSIYLYQLPVFVFYEKLVPNFQPSWWQLIIEVTLVLLISELSYRFVETRFRKPGDMKNRVHRLATSRNRFFGLLAVFVVVILFIGHGLLDPRAGQAQPETALEKKLRQNQSEVAKRNALAKKNAAKTSKNRQNATLTPDQKSLVTNYGLQPAQYLAFQGMAFQAFGDSVMLDAAPYLQEVNPHMVVDAAVGRQAYQTPKIIAQAASSEKLPENILIGLGTNGEIKRQDLDQIMAIVGKKRQVYWMNNFVQSRPWQDSNNQMLAAAQKDYHNLHVVDWYTLAKQHTDWFADDGVHQGPLGDRNYVRLLVETVSRVNHVK
ncbi:acyltransferase family protein [Leuconostoc holzapfelii]|uniref:Acetyltransferase n=1 Tax=Leuconostoc holzapfelii TaxID=434464 RepID=A0A846ZAP9_9LACO|nr:acyltransferase family protein [Leuconostoc holzapfelii]NKZ17828.1 acetyltransferase [Leuconostoc holzapfelii]